MLVSGLPDSNQIVQVICIKCIQVHKEVPNHKICSSKCIWLSNWSTTWKI